MPDLVVSLDHIAVLREKRRSNEPDPVTAAVIAEMAGASGVAVHLRGDRRHIQERDVKLLREMVKTRLHLALAPAIEEVRFAYAVKPDRVNLVPERRDEVSSSIGLDVMLNQSHLKNKIIRPLKEVGVKAAILIDPDVEQVKASHAAEADAVMINTRLYADSAREREAHDELERIDAAARVARKLKLEVSAGHGLDFSNVAAVAGIAGITAIEVGHGLVAHSVFVGIEAAVRRMVATLAIPSRQPAS